MALGANFFLLVLHFYPLRPQQHTNKFYTQTPVGLEIAGWEGEAAQQSDHRGCLSSCLSTTQISCQSLQTGRHADWMSRRREERTAVITSRQPHPAAQRKDSVPPSPSFSALLSLLHADQLFISLSPFNHLLTPFLFPRTHRSLSLCFLTSSSFSLTQADKNTTTPSSSLSEVNRLDAHACQSACGKPGQGFHRAPRAVIGRGGGKKCRTIWSMCLVSGNCVLKGSRSFLHSSEG